MCGQIFPTAVYMLAKQSTSHANNVGPGLCFFFARAHGVPRRAAAVAAAAAAATAAAVRGTKEVVVKHVRRDVCSLAARGEGGLSQSEWGR